MTNKMGCCGCYRSRNYDSVLNTFDEVKQRENLAWLLEDNESINNYLLSSRLPNSAVPNRIIVEPASIADL